MMTRAQIIWEMTGVQFDAEQSGELADQQILGRLIQCVAYKDGKNRRAHWFIDGTSAKFDEILNILENQQVTL